MSKLLKWLRPSGRGKDLVIITLLFVLALSISLFYQSRSEISSPIRADAAEYFFTAYNLYQHSVYNPSPPSRDGTAPEDFNFLRQPGYPLFLYLFFMLTPYVKFSFQEFVSLITTAQAVVGSLTVVLIYIFARFSLARPWAFLAGLFTALSPHLIAMQHFVLTETLYTFVLVAGAIVFVLSWKRQSMVLAIVAGALFGYAFLTHIIAIFLGPFLGILFLVNKKKMRFSLKLSGLKFSLIFLLGFFLIAVPYVAFKKSQKSASYTSFAGQYKAGIWANIVVSTDIGLKHFQDFKHDPEYKKTLEKMNDDTGYAFKIFSGRILAQPWSQMKWFLYGKLFYLWRWDSFYVGDVYQYPMIRKGFEDNLALETVHLLMRLLHWPLFILTLSSPFIMILVWRRGLKEYQVFMLLPLIIFLYYYCIFLIKAPLPRYGLPLRPFTYVMAMWSLFQIAAFVGNTWTLWRQGLQEKEV